MATYLVNFSNNGLGTNRATLTEQNIYGASRIGMRRKSIALYENTTVPYIIPDVKQNTLGDVAYEITNYLGNVNVVISDRKIYVPATGAFKACTLSRTDYFPFGMEISSRTSNSDNYRFGYTGKEDDSEIKGNGNSYDFGNRQYDPRIGRWLSLDPLKAMYPSMSPYCYAGNTPIAAKDPDGRLIIFVNGYTGSYDVENAMKIGMAFGQNGPYTAFKLVKQCSAYKPYWTEKGDGYLKAASNYFDNDKNFQFVNGEGPALSTANDRQAAGRAFMTAERILEFKNALSAGESINFVSHSMGSAFSEGMIEEMMKDETLRAAMERGKIVHFSAADASDIKISSNSSSLKRIQISTTNDNTLDMADPLTHDTDRIIKGVTSFGLVNWDINKIHPGHSKWDSHYDTKTFDYSFNWVKDLERINTKFDHSSRLFSWTGGWGFINYYQLSNKLNTEFKSFKFGDNSQKYLNKDQKLYETKPFW